MAVQRLSYGSFDGYFFSIYYDTDQFSPGFSPAPGFQGYEERVANWSLRYEGQDTNTPGIIPSRLDLTLVMSDAYLRTYLQNARGGVWIKMYNGLSLEWAGYAIPDLGSIEVINGQRFITLAFGDGFGMLDFQANEYVYTNVKAFTNQIMEILNRLEFSRLWDGLLVANTLKAANAGSGKEGLYWTGTLQEGLYYQADDPEWQTYRSVIDQILTIFGLRMYQEKGYLVVREIAIDTPSQWHAYDWAGDYVTSFSYTSSQSANVIAGGTEMYLPAVRSLKTTTTVTQDRIALISTKAPRLNYYVGDVIPTGSNHLDGYASMVAYFRVDPSTPRTDVFFDIFAVIRVGAYYYNGTSWTTTLSQFQIVNNHKDSIENLGGSEAIVAGLPFAITNFHTSDLPEAGIAPLYITYTIVETGGPYAGIQVERIDSSIEYYYHGDLPDQTVFHIDNGASRNGIDRDYFVTIGEKTDGSPVAQQLRTFYLEPRGVATLVPSNWDGDSLLHRSALRMAQKQARPVQYYEIELDERISFSHAASWGSDTYIPMNLEINSDGSKVTYIEQITEDPVRDSKFQPA